MKAVNYSDARQKLKELLDDVCAAHEPVIITRKRGENAVVLSQEDYDSLMETEYLLKEPANARRLWESLQQARAGQRAPLAKPAEGPRESKVRKAAK
jgi:antitoxin YefM